MDRWDFYIGIIAILVALSVLVQCAKKEIIERIDSLNIQPPISNVVYEVNHPIGQD